MTPFSTPSVDSLIEKVPPQNLEAEMAVLGSLLIDEEAVPIGMELLKPEYFYRDTHRKIFSAMTKLFTRQRPVDLVTLTEELKSSGELEGVGGASTLASLTTVVPTAASIQHYAKIVKEKALLRNLINTATQIVGECFENQDDVEGLLDKAEQLLFEISTKSSESRAVLLKEMLKDSIEAIERLYQRKELVTGVSTGLHDLDVQTAGLQPSDLVIVAGRPSMGKSALVTCIAEHVGIVERIPVVVFSLEMSKEQLVHRMLCAHARVDVHKARTGFLAQSDWPRLTNAAGKLSEAPILVDDTPAISALELRAKARRLKSQHDVGLIVVDYLQMMRGPARSENRQQEISEISKSLKALAKELKVPVVAVSQLSRAPEQREDRRPQLADLRESGAIEQDADVVMLLFREEVYHPTDENRGRAEVIIAKQRNGPVGSIPMTFLKEFTRFENLSPRS
ncbi:MAG: replicative DNA helicase [Candidatus Omnitrophica bacterium]|nr:replicative DNA helicase [Candidatus Omnitrophota bacterium]